VSAPDRVNLWHGYSLAAIDRLARIAAARAIGGRILDYSDRYDAAWHAIAETLCTATEAPIPRDLAVAGMTAISRLAQDHRHTWGMDRTWGSAEGDMAAYQRYWELERRAASSPEEPVVDRLALRQIWPRLSRTHQQVLYALAIHGNHATAASSLGKTTLTFRSHLRNARTEYLALWHEHETPSRMWGRSGETGRRTAAETLVNRRQQRARRAAAAMAKAA
jgi:hypothetical protein